VRRPRLRKKRPGQDGEVLVLAYEAMQGDGRLGSRTLEILLRGFDPTIQARAAGDGQNGWGVEVQCERGGYRSQ